MNIIVEFIKNCEEKNGQVCDTCPVAGECLMYWTGDDTLLKEKSKPKEKMTVGELKEILNNFSDDIVVWVEGGEDGNGEWAAFGAGPMIILEG